MMAPAVPIIISPDYPIMEITTNGGEGVERTCGKIGVQYCFPRKSGVLLIAVLEIVRKYICIVLCILKNSTI